MSKRKYDDSCDDGQNTPNKKPRSRTLDYGSVQALLVGLIPRLSSRPLQLLAKVNKLFAATFPEWMPLFYESRKQPHGNVTTHYTKGTLVQKYRDGLLHGDSVYTEGPYTRICPYHNGTLHGSLKVFKEMGEQCELLKELQIVRGVPHGRTTTIRGCSYYFCGTKCQSAEFQANVLQLEKAFPDQEDREHYIEQNFPKFRPRNYPY